MGETVEQSKDKEEGFIFKVKADARANGFSGASLLTIMRLALFHPGFLVLLMHRIQVELLHFGIIGRLISRILWRIQVTVSGCYISPTATLGSGIHLPHATGIVIGGDAFVGNGTTIYQHVTLGRRDLNDPKYPVVGSCVILSSGAQVLGAVVVGNNAIVGANAVILKDIPDHKIAVGIPARILE